jgi:putative ABC transport system substrate-binding protein
MDRRTFISSVAFGLVSAPRGVDAQPMKAFPRIGWLGGPTRESAEPFVRAFMQGLNELGWFERQNIVIEWRFAGGRAERLRGLAAELVDLRVDVIVVPTTPPALAAKNATNTIPIVTLAVGDPVSLGLVSSLARPEGNITGLTSSVDPRLIGKLLELLRESVPKASRVAVLLNPTTPGNTVVVREAGIAAAALGIDLQLLEARSVNDFDTAFAAINPKHAIALLVVSDILFVTHRNRLADLAARSHLPAIYGHREYVEAGGLMSYGPVILDLFRRGATYVDRILKGAKAAELPMQQPAKFELVINLKTAKALGIAIPQTLLLRADEVIQ